jgi:two-component sensor histidine kinase
MNISFFPKHAQETLMTSEAFTQMVINALTDHIAVLDAQGTITAVNDAWERFGRANGTSSLVYTGVGLNYLAVCEQAAATGEQTAREALLGLQAVLRGTCAKFALEYPCHAPTEERWFLLRATPLPPQEGGIVITHTDVTARKQAEEALKAALRQKEVLLKEVHHRVKNNLQVIASLLHLQADTILDPQIRAPLEDSQHRIHSMALIHDNVYQSHDIAHIDVADYLSRLSTRLFNAYGAPADRIALKIEVEEVWLEVNTVIPYGLLLNELLSNALKHAFPGGRAGEIRIALRQEPPGTCRLSVSDTGIGLPQALDFRHTNSLGLQLVCLLTEQLDGNIELELGGGTAFTITLPISSAA